MPNIKFKDIAICDNGMLIDLNNNIWTFKIDWVKDDIVELTQQTDFKVRSIAMSEYKFSDH